MIGVNFLRPGREDIPAVQEAAVRMPYVECFWAEPDPAIVRIIHAGGALAGWQVGSAREARDAENAGCDLIIAQGVEAGGHVRETLGLLPLLDEVRAVTNLPIVGAGGIGTGHAMAGALAAGAEAVRVGTRFMAATESTAHPAYIDGLLRSGAEDTILTTVFGGATYTGAAEARALYAGQSVAGARKRQSAAEIVAELVGEAEMRLTQTVY